MNIEKIVEDFIKDCNIEILKKDAETNIGIAKLSSDFEHEDRYETYLGDIVSGSYGQYQAKIICEHFGLDYSENDNEWIWEDIDKVSDSIADKLTSLVGLNGRFYFGHLDADGSYGLFYFEEKEGV